MPHPSIKGIQELKLKGKKLFLRLDLNVPLSDPDPNGVRQVTDDNRIVQALPTIQHAIDSGAKVILASHLGRPKGKALPEFSLNPVATYLAEKAGIEVMLADDCVGDGIELTAQNLNPGQVLLLENLRFHKEEEKNDSSFAAKLSRLCDVYVSDAFGAAHRKHASTFGLPEVAAEIGMGFLIEKELEFLNRIQENPERPFYTILGGAKVSDKIKTVENLLRRVDGLVVGGAMAYAFMASQGKNIPPEWKQPAEEDIAAAGKILSMAKDKGIAILLPEDTNDGFDIGPKTIERFGNYLQKAKTIFWNGPLGWFEKSDYAKGTFDIAQKLADVPALKVVGGGDTVAAIRKSGLAEKFDHLSTGGGAVLEYLEGKGLPGIDVLRSNKNKPTSPELS